MKLRSVALAAVVAVAVLVPATAASAGHHRDRLDLALVPLQTKQLGPKNASLALDYGSGPTEGGLFSIISISLSSRLSFPGEGDLGGYALDYGDPYTGSTGVTEIRTSVEQYKTRAKAKEGLAGARFLDAFFEPLLLSSPFVHVTKTKVKPLPIGQRRFGYLITQAAPNLNPIVRLDEQVLAGRFVLDLTVTAGSESAAEHVAPHLLLVLRRRLQLLLEGHPAGSRVKLPPEPRAGQAEGGPDLSTLILQPPDIGQSHAVNLIQGYTATPPALSGFFMTLEPAGTYDQLQQQIAWWPTATEATYGEIYASSNPFFSFGIGIGLGFAGRAGHGFGQTVTPVDLSSLDDPATGYLVTGDGQSEALVTMTNGQTGEAITGSKDGTLQASDVLSLAQAAANRLDAGLGP
jgi:hypothetical protein